MAKAIQFTVLLGQEKKQCWIEEGQSLKAWCEASKIDTKNVTFFVGEQAEKRIDHNYHPGQGETVVIRKLAPVEFAIAENLSDLRTTLADIIGTGEWKISGNVVWDSKNYIATLVPDLKKDEEHD